ncbi:MAG: 16S rRNA (adenine(1518)-N(6)/adenine(1519)-N(6))-dimethyltransferase RsmA [Rickettsiales bacterium]
MVSEKLPSLEEVIKKHSLFTRKSLGQHFLLDEMILTKVVASAGSLKGINVIEIGSGPGGLTRLLLASEALSVTVVEKDERCVRIMEELSEFFVDGRLHIISEDALKVDLIDIVPAPRKIVANLPYNVASQLLIKWFDDIYRNGRDNSYESLTLMFQDEVAKRVVATPDDNEYGRLSVLTSFLCDSYYDFQLRPEFFVPPPKVNSAVVTILPKEKPVSTVTKNILEKILATAFGKRRKMLRSSLKDLGINAAALLENSGIDGTLRAENLTVEEFCRLAEVYESIVT